MISLIAESLPFLYFEAIIAWGRVGVKGSLLLYDEGHDYVINIVVFIFSFEIFWHYAVNLKA